MTRTESAWKDAAMKTNRHSTHPIPSRAAMRGVVSAQAVVVLAVITACTGLLAYEWHSAHATKSHHGSMPAHHHKNHEAKTASAH